VELPFTSEEFFGVFARYNQAFWPIAVILWLACAAALVAAWRNPARHSRTLTWMLAALWLWNAVAYHAWLFTRINPAAWVFAALFAFEALLLSRAAVRAPVQYFSTRGAIEWIAVGLVAYALAYPFLAVAVHAYPATPTFGVPCPTAIVTIAALLTARGGPPVACSIVPAAWGFVGGSAALLLGVWPDYVLLGAGILLTAILVTRGRGFLVR
jgi:Family of unknown function (DUF6064)